MRVTLLGPSDVNMALEPDLVSQVSNLSGYRETEEVMIHYTVTRSCRFNCTGCINALTAGKREAKGRSGKSGDAPDDNPERDAKATAELIKSSGKPEAVVVFYGGEPMLRLDKMKRFYDVLNRVNHRCSRIRYMTITSGHYLETAAKIFPEMMANMWLTAVSVDGMEAQHNAARRGTSLQTIREQVAAFDRIRMGQVLIWSTIRPSMSMWDCFRSFMHFRAFGQAEHFFWHWDEADGAIDDLETHLNGYTHDLHQVMRSYLSHLQSGDLLSIVHINELIVYLLTGKRRGSTACGVEKMANFDLVGDGKIHACADLPATMEIGDISAEGEVAFRPEAGTQLARLVTYKDELGCFRCGIEPYCGGRCPVQAHVGGIERARQYCFMMRSHVNTVKGYAREVVHWMHRHEMTLEDLYRSARMARFTDVTP